MAIEFPKTAQVVATIASNEDNQRDIHGFVNPNLHRRVDPQEPAPESDEVRPRSYILGVYDGLNSYRTETIYTHDEESTTCEIP